MQTNNESPAGGSAQETSSVTDSVAVEVMNLIKKHPKGISDQTIQAELPYLSPEERVKVINQLLSSGHLDLFEQGGKPLYKYKEPGKISNVKGADNEEKVVYSIIESAGNKGIWIRDIRFQSNLLPTQLNKILKALENKKLIKAVKSVSASKKKVYMLYNLEPDKSLTGGAWYSDQDFEAEFVGVLSQQCYRFLQQKQERLKDFQGSPLQWKSMSYASSKEVWKFISELGVSRVKLAVEDIETILDTIVYDGKVAKAVDVDLSKMYRAVEPLLPAPGIVRTPCGVCPVFQFCGDVGSVTPKKCEYLKEWLNEFTYLQKKARPVQTSVLTIRAKNAAQQQASAKNRRLAMQMEKRLSAMAALKIKKKIIKQRLGAPNTSTGNIKDRLTLPNRGKGGFRRGRGGRQARGNLRRSQSMQSLQGGSLKRTASMQSLNQQAVPRGRSRSRSRTRARTPSRNRSNSVNRQLAISPSVAPKRRGSFGAPITGLGRGGRRVPAGVRNQRLRNQGNKFGRNSRGAGNSRGGRGSPRRGGGRGGRRGRMQGGRRGRSRPMRGKAGGSQPTKEELDKQLEQYMANTKSHLDKEIDIYMKESGVEEW